MTERAPNHHPSDKLCGGNSFDIPVLLEPFDLTGMSFLRVLRLFLRRTSGRLRGC